MAERTKAELREEVAELKDQLERAKQRADHDVERARADLAKIDPEARALSTCVQALDQLPKRNTWDDVSPVGRVLSALTERYGLPNTQAQVGEYRARAEEAESELEMLREHVRGIIGALEGTL